MKFSNLVDHWKGLNSRILSWHSDGKLNFELMGVIDGRFSGGGGGGGGLYIKNAASMISNVNITDSVALDRPLEVWQK